MLLMFVVALFLCSGAGNAARVAMSADEKEWPHALYSFGLAMVSMISALIFLRLLIKEW